jgi:hypothetical protein
MIASPRMPTMPRDSRPSGFTSRIAQSGRLAFDDATGAFRGEVAGREAGATGADDESGEPVAHRRERSSHLVGAIGGDTVLDHVEPCGTQAGNEGSTAQILAGSVHHTIAHGEHLGPQRCRVGGRRVGHGSRR